MGFGDLVLLWQERLRFNLPPKHKNTKLHGSIFAFVAEKAFFSFKAEEMNNYRMLLLY